MSNQQLYNQHRANGVPHDEAAAALGVSQDAARMLKSRYNKASSPATPKPAKVATQAPVKRAETPQVERKPKQRRFTMPTAEALRSYALDVLLIAVVVGHAGLVWFDTADRWGTPGMIGGGVVFLIVLAALLLASDETKPRTSEAALAFVFVTDFAAWFVHFPVFKDRAQIGDVETGMFAGFLCAASFTALYLYRDKNLD